MANLLGRFLHDANLMGANPTEAMDALIDCAGRVYAAKIADTPTTKERRRARRMFMRNVNRTVFDLPTAERDGEIEAELMRRGLWNG